MEWLVATTTIVLHVCSFSYLYLCWYEKEEPVTPPQEVFAERARNIDQRYGRLLRRAYEEYRQSRSRRIDFDWKKEGF